MNSSIRNVSEEEMNENQNLLWFRNDISRPISHSGFIRRIYSYEKLFSQTRINAH